VTGTAPPPTSAFPLTKPRVPSEPPPTPIDWLAARSLLEPPPGEPATPPRRRRNDGSEAAELPADLTATTQRPAVPVRPSSTARPPEARPGHPQPTPPGAGPRTGPSAVARPEFDRSAVRFAEREEAPAAPANPELARILADNGAAPTTGGRRRRRYREDGDSDDVLARVLRGD
jgi:hypothetical protein